jgi:hypothetical protein
MGDLSLGSAAVAACAQCGALPSCAAQGLVDWVYACTTCGLIGQTHQDIVQAQASWNAIYGAPQAPSKDER